MKKLIILLAILFISCDNTVVVEGTITGEAEMDPTTLQKLFGVMEGEYYYIKYHGNDYFIYTHEQKIIEKGSKGKFTLGEVMFNGSTFEYQDGEKVEIKVEARELIKFEE